MNFLGQFLANSFNTEVVEYKHSNLLFIFNKRQVVVNISVSDPPFTIPQTVRPTFVPRPTNKEITNFSIKERELKNQQKEKELLDYENELNETKARLDLLQEELLKREQDLNISIAAFNESSDSLALREIKVADQEKELNRGRAALKLEQESLQNQRITLKSEQEALQNQQTTLKSEQESLQNQRDMLKSEQESLQNQRTTFLSEKEELTLTESSKLEDRESRLLSRTKELDQKEIELNISKNQLQEKEAILNDMEKNLKIQEIKLNNHINDALVRQKELDDKEKELSKIKQVLDETKQNLNAREKAIEIKERQIKSIDVSDPRTPLDSPILTIENINNVTYLKWNIIEDADNYTINYLFNSRPVDTSNIDFDVKLTDKFVFVNLTSFTETGEYEFSITAIADENNKKKNSIPSEPITYFVYDNRN